jgi:hypothetical protein
MTIMPLHDQDDPESEHDHGGPGDTRNQAGDIHGPLVQAGTIHGDVTVHHTPDPLATHPEPFIITVNPGPADRTSFRGFTSPHRITVLVEGRGAQAVILHALRPVTLGRGLRPLRREVSPRLFRVDFDDRPVDASDIESGLYADLVRLEPRFRPATGGPDFPFAVHSSEPELFTITAFLQSRRVQAVEWRLELDWTCAGRNGTFVIPETFWLRARL